MRLIAGGKYAQRERERRRLVLSLCGCYRALLLVFFSRAASHMFVWVIFTADRQAAVEKWEEEMKEKRERELATKKLDLYTSEEDKEKALLVCVCTHNQRMLKWRCCSQIHHLLRIIHSVLLKHRGQHCVTPPHSTRASHVLRVSVSLPLSCLVLHTPYAIPHLMPSSNASIASILHSPYDLGPITSWSPLR